MSHDMIKVEREKSGKTVTKLLTYPTGYSQLPLDGGVLDQPYRMMCFFSYFESGEQEAFSIKLN